MKISTKSTIYRSYEFQWGLTNPDRGFYPSENLCTFLRRYFFRCLFTLATGAFIAICAVGFIIFPYFFYLTRNFNNAVDSVGVITFLGSLVWIFGITITIACSIVAIFYGLGKMWDYIFDKAQYSDNILVEYIKGKKNKYCPAIQFVDPLKIDDDGDNDLDLYEYSGRH